jgi:hypothetical protein
MDGSMKRIPSKEEKTELRAVFDSLPASACLDCGGFHLRACPRIRRQVWLGNGNRVEVEYWAEWDDSEVIYPEEVFDEETDE